MNRKLLALLVLSGLLLAFYPGRPLDTKVIIIYQKAGKLSSTVVSLSKLPQAISKISSAGGVIVRKIHLWRIQWSPAWQVDTDHLDVPPVWQLVDKRGIPVNVKVAVVDTGIKDLGISNLDLSEAKAITEYIDELAEFGKCNDTGTMTFSGDLTFLNAFVYHGGEKVNVTLPSGVEFKYCLFSQPLDWFGDGTNSTVIFIQATDPTVDVVGHGTFVASQIDGYVQALGLATGVEPKIQVIPIKADTLAIVLYNVTGCDSAPDCIEGTPWDRRILDGGFFPDPNIVAAAQYLANLTQSDGYLKVVNMSIGGWDTKDSMDVMCYETVEKMASAGLYVVVAAGNDGVDIDEINNAQGYYEFPAQCPSAIAVSAIDESHSLAVFSNYGSVIKFAAPGDDNVGLYPYSSLIANVIMYYNQPVLYADAGGGYLVAKDSGTSYASPLVAGSVALAIALGAKDPVKALALSARDLFTTGFDTYSGYGEPNLNGLADYLGYYPSTTTSTTAQETTTTTTSASVPSVFLLAPIAIAIGRRGARKKQN